MGTTVIDELAELVEAGLAKGAADALSVAALDGDDVTAGAWGFASTGRPATTATLFQAASIGKPVTAFAALRLVAAGELDLDADVNDRLRTWTLPMPYGWRPRVTVRHLLCHAGALTVHGFPGYRPGDPLPTVAQILDGVPPANTGPVRVQGIPGLAAHYSGGGYTMLGQLLVDVTDVPFPHLMDELVLGPLGMENATYAAALPEGLAGRASFGREDGEPVPGGWPEHPEMGAAGLWCTPSDLIRFAAGVQAAAAGRSGALLPVDLARDLLTEQVPGWGLGVVLDGEGDSRQFSHTGRNAGFLALLIATCAPGHAVAVMANANTAGPLMRAVAARAAALHGWVGFERPEPPDLAGAACRLAGAYLTEDGSRFEIADGDALTLAVPGQPPLSLEPVTPTTWLAEPVRAEVEVEVEPGGSGDPVAILVRQLGTTIRAARQPASGR